MPVIEKRIIYGSHYQQKKTSSPDSSRKYTADSYKNEY